MAMQLCNLCQEYLCPKSLKSVNPFQSYKSITSGSYFETQCSYKTAEDTSFKFSRCVPSESPEMTLTKVSDMWAWSGSRDPVNFWELNANSSKTAKDTNFKFGRRAPSDSPDMNLTDVSEKWAWSRSRDPVNFWALNANSSETA